MTEFTADEREYALMLGLHADDSGYVQWDPATLLADIYRWVDVAAREAMADGFNAHLAATGRLVVLPCGIHAVLPKLRERPRHGKPVHVVRDEHGRKCSNVASGAEPRSDLSPTKDGPDVSVAWLGVASLGDARTNGVAGTPSFGADAPWNVRARLIEEVDTELQRQRAPSKDEPDVTEPHLAGETPPSENAGSPSGPSA
jgi:hypothetical protein